MFIANSLFSRGSFVCISFLLLSFFQPLRAKEVQERISVHGNAFVASNRLQLTVDGERHSSWGVSYIASSGTKMWFHAPMPVVSSPNKSGLFATQVSVLYKSKNSMITDIQLWDGALLLESLVSLKLQGDQSVRLSELNQFPIKAIYPIGAGLGISVGVVFGNDGSLGDLAVGEMIFTGASVTYVAKDSINSATPVNPAFNNTDTKSPN